MWNMTQAWSTSLKLSPSTLSTGNYASGWNSDWGSFADRAAWVLGHVGSWMHHSTESSRKLWGVEKTHQDYARDGLDATQVCCACGSGVVEASNVPFASQDSKSNHDSTHFQRKTKITTHLRSLLDEFYHFFCCLHVFFERLKLRRLHNWIFFGKTPGVSWTHQWSWCQLWWSWWLHRSSGNYHCNSSGPREILGCPKRHELDLYSLSPPPPRMQWWQISRRFKGWNSQSPPKMYQKKTWYCLVIVSKPASWGGVGRSKAIRQGELRVTVVPFAVCDGDQHHWHHRNHHHGDGYNTDAGLNLRWGKGNTVDGWNPKQPPGMVLKPCKYWEKLPTSTGAGFQPSTVWTVRNFIQSGMNISTKCEAGQLKKTSGTKNAPKRRFQVIFSIPFIQQIVWVFFFLISIFCLALFSIHPSIQVRCVYWTYACYFAITLDGTFWCYLSWSTDVFLKDANEYHLGHTDQQHSDKQYCNYATWIKIWTSISYQMWWFRSWSISCFFFGK